MKAICGYRVLGQVADPAVPELVRFIKDAPAGEGVISALEALCAIGSERAFDGVLSLEGVHQMFTRKLLANEFVTRNPGMADYVNRKLKAADESRP